jgi:hypothetical protein
VSPSIERRLLQATVALACIVPLLAGGSGMLHGPRMADPGSTPIDLDSHFRYLSGLLLGIGLGFLTTVPAIERNGARFRLLGAIVVIGGLGRLLSLIIIGVPSHGQIFGLAMELGVVPLLMLWQRHVAHRCADMASK